MFTCEMYDHIPRFISYKRLYHFVFISLSCNDDNDDDNNDNDEYDDNDDDHYVSP